MAEAVARAAELLLRVGLDRVPVGDWWERLPVRVYAALAVGLREGAITPFLTGIDDPTNTDARVWLAVQDLGTWSRRINSKAKVNLPPLYNM